MRIIKEDSMKEQEFRELVGVAIGEASVAWKPMGEPVGVFDADKCVELIDRIVDAWKRAA